MSRTRMWQLGGALAAVVVLVASWMLVIGPTRDEAAALRTQADDMAAQAQALQGKISLLKKQSRELPAQEAKLAEVARKLPADPALPSLVRSLSQVASMSKVTLEGLTPGAPTPLELPAQGKPAADPSAEASAAPSAAAAQQPSAPVSQLNAVPLQLNVCGEFAGIREFLNRVETMQRSMLITNFTVARGGSCGPQDSDSQLNVQISGRVFTLPSPSTGVAAKPQPQTSGAAVASGTAK